MAAERADRLSELAIALSRRVARLEAQTRRDQDTIFSLQYEVVRADSSRYAVAQARIAELERQIVRETQLHEESMDSMIRAFTQR